MTTTAAGSKAVFARDPSATRDLFEYSEISSQETIAGGTKIRDWFQLMVDQPFSVQRLTDRVYFVGVSFYNSVFFVGDEGVLLVNPLSGPATPPLLAAIREVTSLPVTTLVYSHYHLDHVEGAIEVVRAAEANPTPLRIVATDLTAARIAKFGNKIPSPNEVVAGHDTACEFENLTVRLRTPDDNGHCVDNAMVLLVEERVVQFDDMINPGMMPFPKFATQEDLIAYEENLHEVHGLDWIHINGGHGNIGGKDDVAFYLSYIERLRAATGAAMEEIDLSAFVVPSHTHMNQWLNYQHAVAAAVKLSLRPQYGRYYGFEEAVPSHVEMMIDAIVSY